MSTQSSSSIVARLAVAVSAAALSLSAAVAAQASNWTGSGTDANWSTAENWDVAVDESSGVAAFPYGTSGDSVVDKDYTLSSLSFLNGADAIRLSVAEGKPLSAGDRVRIASEDYSTCGGRDSDVAVRRYLPHLGQQGHGQRNGDGRG